MKAVRETLLLLLVASFPAALAVAFHPALADRDRVGLEPHAVRLVEARAWKSPVVWVDARSREEFARDTIPLAVNLPPDDFEAGLGAVLAAWIPGARVVVFCGSLACDSSRDAAQRLREAGLEDVYHLHGGWEAWLEARAP